MKRQTVARVRRFSLAAFLIAWPVLLWLAWYSAPDWSLEPDVSAPLTRKLLFFHPASAWAAFAAYFVVFACSIAVLNERALRYDAPARAAAEVGFTMNTIALVTGTLWGIQEWSRSGSSALATVYTEPKTVVVVVMWLTFLAYLLLRQWVDGPERQARLAAAFGVLGFLGVPLSFATSRIVQTSLHPDIAGPAKNPDADIGTGVGLILVWSLVTFFSLFVYLWLARLRLARQGERIDELERLDEARRDATTSLETTHA